MRVINDHATNLLEKFRLSARRCPPYKLERLDKCETAAEAKSKEENSKNAWIERTIRRQPPVGKQMEHEGMKISVENTQQEL